MAKYNPNQTLRAWALMPVYSLGVFILGDVLTRSLSWGPIFAYNTWVLYLLFCTASIFWFFTWRAFPVFYVSKGVYISYRRFFRLHPIPAGIVTGIEPIAGRVNLFLRPDGMVIYLLLDEDRSIRLYVLAGDTEFENILTLSFPGRVKPPSPGR